MEGLKILVVEDERLVALDIERRLAKIGYSVTTAADGENGISAAAASRPDLVLMDIRLGRHMDGIEAARRIRESLDVPVVYVTAFADPDTLARAKITEPFGYIVKPFQERELKAAVEVALYRHRAEQKLKEQERWQRFLAEASAQLSASLDYEDMLQVTGSLLVPGQADWCLIWLEAIDDGIPRLALVRSVTATHHEPPVVARPPASVIDSVIRTGVRQIVSGVTDQAWWAGALGSEHADELHEIGARWLACLPLRARGRIFGALVLVSAQRRLCFGPLGLAAIEQLAQHLAISIDNALLFRKTQRAVRMRDDVLAIVSHDLRGPLSVIRLCAEQHIADPPFAVHSQAILRATERMQRLIDDLLDTASIDAGRLFIEPGAHSAAQLTNEALETVRAAAGERSIVLVDAVPTDNPPIACDRYRTLQILSNLLGNAIKFTQPGGSITVRAERRNSHLCFAVADNGPGIPADQVPLLFERFWRAAPGNRDSSGLGLYITKGIVEAQGGRLWVDSTVGGGTTFFFTLPLAS
jgi:signal transduction histidine kinase/CheY-like chemotaxis protein